MWNVRSDDDDLVAVFSDDDDGNDLADLVAI